MRALTVLIASATALGYAPFASRFGAVLGATLSVLLGVLLALAASYSVNALAVAGGALGAFASGVLYEAGPALAGAALVGLCYAERTLRVRDKNSRIVHLILALGAGALAGYASSRYAGAELLVRGVVAAIAAVLAAAPLLVPADDSVAFALDELANDADDATATQLSRAAELRRSVDETLLDRDADRDARRAWKNLLRLAQARSRLSRRAEQAPEAVVRRLDQRIADHVSSLTRMYTAADAASAATLSLDDGTLANVDTAGESLDEISKAMVEDVA
jgi:hypothetical protein